MLLLNSFDLELFHITVLGLFYTSVMSFLPTYSHSFSQTCCCASFLPSFLKAQILCIYIYIYMYTAVTVGENALLASLSYFFLMKAKKTAVGWLIVCGSRFLRYKHTFPPSIHAALRDSLALIPQQFLPVVGDRQLLPCMSPARVTTQGRETEAGLFGITLVLRALLMEICSNAISTSRASFTLMQSGTIFLFIPKKKEWGEKRILAQSALSIAKALVQRRR